ncbi:0ec417b8-4c77-437c-acb7-45a611a7a6a4 [Sclerotinia trifoliorum]|uniref:0ec417b8-4c77-437c-acb7-45a611a7a6a4 n=1 Tax=Sclerotinia trifoliorum TaxID=28548 RepID=A0A8H2VNU4_9HELO|nr:0ec417b8-4c77-437c-acb7-45a611a7a6a4 [Sclerotinia trifoliorum]
MKTPTTITFILLLVTNVHASSESLFKRTLCSRAVEPQLNTTTNCGVYGTITQRGGGKINMWPSQPLHSSPEDCGAYCQQLIGNYSQSFSIQSSSNSTGYSCSCYQFGVGALKLKNGTDGDLKTVAYYDTACFSFSSC